MTKHQPASLEQLKALRRPVRNVNLERREKLSRLDKLALFVTVRVGTMGFFLIILGWTILWLGWNIVAPRELRFDPFPAFVLWLFISNMIQILLMPLIMVGQNLQGRHSEARAEAEYELNIQKGREIDTILQHLENQNEALARIIGLLDKEEKQPGA